MKTLFISILNRMFKNCMLPSNDTFISLLDEYTAYTYNIVPVSVEGNVRAFSFTNKTTLVEDAVLYFTINSVGTVSDINVSEKILKKVA